METRGGIEGQAVFLKRARARPRGVVAGGPRLSCLQNQVDWVRIVGSIELVREELDVDFLRIVKVLFVLTPSVIVDEARSKRARNVKIGASVDSSITNEAMGENHTYPKEGRACSWDVGHFQFHPIRAVEIVQPRGCDFGILHHAIDDLASNDELQATAAATTATFTVSITGFAVFPCCRDVRHGILRDVGHAKRPSRSASGLGERLAVPPPRPIVLAVEIVDSREVTLEQIREDNI